MSHFNRNHTSAKPNDNIMVTAVFSSQFLHDGPYDNDFLIEMVHVNSSQQGNCLYFQKQALQEKIWSGRVYIIGCGAGGRGWGGGRGGEGRQLNQIHTDASARTSLLRSIHETFV